MEKSEYLILEYAIWSYIPLACLTSPNLPELFNREGHGLSRRRLETLLTRMFADGDIEARVDPCPVDDARHWFKPTEAELRGGLDHRQIDIAYRLTSQGGRRWEVASNTDWTRYCDWHTMAQTEPAEAHWASLDRKLLEETLTLASLGPHALFVDLRALTWDELPVWKPTYWKSLPNAHRVRFPYRDTLRPGRCKLDVYWCSAWHRWWYDRGWYNEPFERRKPKPAMPPAPED